MLQLIIFCLQVTYKINNFKICANNNNNQGIIAKWHKLVAQIFTIITNSLNK